MHESLNAVIKNDNINWFAILDPLNINAKDNF